MNIKFIKLPASQKCMGKDEEETHIAIFNGKKIRKKLVNNEWFFSVVDVSGALTDSEDPRNYWKVLKSRLIEEGSEVVTFCNQLKLPAEDGNLRVVDKMSTTEGRVQIVRTLLVSIEESKKPTDRNI